jgi:hypothetical protein
MCFSLFLFSKSNCPDPPQRSLVPIS